MVRIYILTALYFSIGRERKKYIKKESKEERITMAIDLAQIPKASDNEILSKVNQLLVAAKSSTDNLDKFFENKVNEARAAMKDVRMAYAVEMYLEALSRDKTREWLEGLFEGRCMNINDYENESDILQRLALLLKI